MASRKPNFFAGLAKLLADEWTNIAADEKSSAEYSDFIDTGCLGLNALVSGSTQRGIPDNKVVCLAGEFATGKTFLMLGVVKAFLDDNPGAGVVLYDTESVITKNMLLSRGIDPSRVIVSEPETIQDFKIKCANLLEVYEKQEERPKMLIVLDSLGMLPTTKEVNDTSDGKSPEDQGARAKTIRGVFRILRLKLSKAHVPMLLTNHVYSGTGPYAPLTNIAGGGGVKYAADVIITLHKKKDYDEALKRTVGALITARSFKGRIAKENQEITLRLNYETGLDKYYGLFELAKNTGAIKKEVKEDKHGVLKEGAKYVVGAAKFSQKELEENPKVLFDDPDMAAAIEASVRAHYMYGSTKELIDPETGEVTEG